MTIQQMLASSPVAPVLDADALADCIEACLECAQTCTACADACLAEDMVADLRTCIRRNLDCADVCATTAAVLSRQVGTDLGFVRVVLEACTIACKRCGAECEDHAGTHVHCGVCAQACRRCEAACRALLEALRDAPVPQPSAGGALSE
jgi:hypothetical protein